MKKNLFFIFLFQAVFVAAQLPSIIKDDYVIRKSMSPLKFNKTYVAKDATLYIEPSVVLEGNKLEVEGTLILIGKEKDSITIKNNHFELDSIFNQNRNESIAIRAEFTLPSDRTVLITNNVFKNYNKAFALELDYNGVYKCETTHFAITGNEVERCNTILSVDTEIGCALGTFVVKNNRFSKFKIAFIDVITQPNKPDKTTFISYRINKNKYDIPLAELLKRIDDFTGDYEKFVRFEVEY